MKPDARLQAAGYEFTIMDGKHKLGVSIGYDTPPGESIQSGRTVEIAFTTRGKIGQGVDLMLQEIGLKLSRAIQGRDPETGEELDHTDG